MENDETFNEVYQRWLKILNNLPREMAIDVAARTIALWYTKSSNKVKIETSYICFEDEIPF